MSEQLTVAELSAMAGRAAAENGFQLVFPPPVEAELRSFDGREPGAVGDSVRDLRALLWSSIDNASSEDLDQIEYAEKLSDGGIKLLIGIADVDAFVPKDSAIDAFAKNQTVTVYTETRIFPMLPEELSTDLTSLRPGADRLAVVVEMIVGENGDVAESSVYRALTHNYAKLTYEEVGVWLDEKAAPPPPAFARVAGLEAQVALQFEAARRLFEFRRRKGSLEFETIESVPVFAGGAATDLTLARPNSARRIIENFMVAANVEMAEFLEAHDLTSIRRVVETPARWERIREVAAEFRETLPAEPSAPALSEFLARRKAADPQHFPDLSLSIVKLVGAGLYAVEKPSAETDGHFGRAVRDYTHSTAPNRRYPDLVVQRLVKAALENRPTPYTDEELAAIAARCNERESAARKVERLMRKVIAASVMRSRVGGVFEAIVTGVTPKGVFARILRPPVDGRVVRGEAGLEVGENVDVRLLATDIEKGFIDFAVERGKN
jgi:exoribonuclease-2